MQPTQLFVILPFLVDLVYCRFEPFIVDGHYAKPGQFPYCAFLSIKCMNDGKYFICGSSIVNQRFTLTAAHCVDECPNDTSIIVYVGNETKRKGAKTTGKTFLIHEDYDIRTLENDIGLVRLTTQLDFITKISRVALMPKPPYKEEAVVAGWGIINDESKEKPKILKYTKQFLKSRKICLKLLKRVNEGTLCGSGPNGHASRGDSGSALVVNGYIQIGIVSYKAKYPTYEDKLTVYTDTGYFYDWIHRTANYMMCTR